MLVVVVALLPIFTERAENATALPRSNRSSRIWQNDQKSFYRIQYTIYFKIIFYKRVDTGTTGTTKYKEGVFSLQRQNP